MNSFVDILPCYNTDTIPSIEELQVLYDDNDQLKLIVEKLFQSHILENDIQDKRVLLKPNWVIHPKRKYDDICLCTHPNIILALIEVLLEWQPRIIIVGDAPVQGCDWSKLLPSIFLKRIEQLSKTSGVQIIIKDFRRVSFSPETNKLEDNKKPLDEYIVFDVGGRSYLEEITSGENLFRVTCYDPDRLAESHHKGVHKYCIAKDVFDCDVIITMPKIKTHQKAGLTNSMKILVGINGDKDYLPHHRIGAVECGGDCYKGAHPFRKMSERVLDEANRHRGMWLYRPLSYLSAGLWRLSKPNLEQNLAAGWYGNDTVWRMVMDLNLIAQYGEKDGTLSDKPVRTLYTFCDGIIAGQGNGPLSPDPLPLGIIAFSNNAFAMDEVAGKLFRLNIDKIPLLKEAKRLNQNDNIEYFIKGNKCALSDMVVYSTDVIMPPGWINYDKK